MVSRKKGGLCVECSKSGRQLRGKWGITCRHVGMMTKSRSCKNWNLQCQCLTLMHQIVTLTHARRSWNCNSIFLTTLSSNFHNFTVPWFLNLWLVWVLSQLSLMVARTMEMHCSVRHSPKNIDSFIMLVMINLWTMLWIGEFLTSLWIISWVTMNTFPVWLNRWRW